MLHCLLVHNSGDVTKLLRDYAAGERAAFDRLFPLVYGDLRKIARLHLRRNLHAGTLNTTGLVHEAYLKMVDQVGLEARDRGHFLAISARAMRQVIVDYARKRQSAKRGGDVRPLSLEDHDIAIEAQAEALLALDTALSRLGRHSDRLARVVECRFFAGLSEEETASALGTSLRTAQRDWLRARAWLKEELSGLES